MNLAFSDLQVLQSITALGRQDRGAALEQVARQFESFLSASIQNFIVSLELSV